MMHRWKKSYWLKWFFVLGSILVIFVIYASFTSKSTSAKPYPAVSFLNQNRSSPKSSKSLGDRWCYFSTDHIDTVRFKLLDDVLLASKRHRPSNRAHNIFFHETSCQPNGIVRLNVRQACAIESAARANPTSSVYLLFASPAGFERKAHPDAADTSTSTIAAAGEVIGALSAYQNIHLRRLNITTYAQGTPAASLIPTPQFSSSARLSAHISNLVRLLSLFRLGGTHLDLDIVVRQPFGNESNYGAEQDIDQMGVAVLNVRRTGIGHRIVARVLREWVAHFEAGSDLEAQNLPLLFGRALRRMCETVSLLECSVFKVHTKDMFYAVRSQWWPELFDAADAKADAVMAMVNGSVAVHMWDELSSGMPVRLGEGSVYERLAQKFCPRVLASVKGGSF